jgi:broad specificity phosphatase PhoE
MMLVRHGETVSNLEQRYHGRRDSPLTERGIAQAQAIGHRLNALLDSSCVELISSPQPRAHRTAEIIRECFASTVSPVRFDERLCEVSIGGWEGLSQAEIVALAPGAFDGDGRHNWCFCAPNGETYAEFEARLTHWLSEISDHPALIVVTHGIVARVLRGLYAGLERSVALSLPIPQDQVFRLAEGKIEEIEVQVGLTMPRFTQVSALAGCRLYVEFDDGVTGTVDVRSLLNSLDESVFEQVVINDFGAVCWPTGHALGPDMIYNCIKDQRVVVG